jgi:hypothetical protein
MLHGGWQAAGGERRGERHPVVVATGLWLGEKFGAQAVLMGMVWFTKLDCSVWLIPGTSHCLGFDFCFFA